MSHTSGISSGNYLNNILGSGGIYDFFLPFLLIFTIIFAVLEKVKLFGTTASGKSRTNINIIVSLIIALITVVQTEIIFIINSYLSRVGLFIVIALAFLLIIGLFGADVEGGFKGGTLAFFFIVAIIAVIWALAPTLGYDLPFWAYVTGTDFIAIAGLIIFIIVIIMLGKGEGGGSAENPFVKWGKELGKGGH